MPAAYSADIRGRVIASVESGSSRREAAEEFDVSASSAIKWVAAHRTTGICAAKPRGGSTSPLEKYANFLLTLIEVQPDLTLDGSHLNSRSPLCGASGPERSDDNLGPTPNLAT
jgi:transposase